MNLCLDECGVLYECMYSLPRPTIPMTLVMCTVMPGSHAESTMYT